MTRFADAIAYAYRYWYQPCHDGLVWGPSNPVSIADQYNYFGVTPVEWMPIFLNYRRTPTAEYRTHSAEGLYLIPKTDFNLDKVITNNTGSTPDLNTNFPNRKFVCSWYDHEKDTESGESPRYTGLDDCAHFLSNCLSAQDIKVSTPSAPKVVENLRGRHDTKTLADLVAESKAARIIDSGIVQSGDAIFYGNKRDSFRYWHSSIFLDGIGRGRVATHTFSNHLEMWKKDQRFDWHINIVPPQHELVTIIHFASGDGFIDNPNSQMLGWWTISGIDQTYYHYFSNGGRVGWVLPRNYTGPHFFPDQQKGYWFEGPTNVKICWTHTGTFEVFDKISGGLSRLSGTRDDIPGLTAARGILTS